MTQPKFVVPHTVLFRSAELLLVDRGGDPYVPMKPVVEGIGLNWKSHHTKLSSGRFASTMVEITIVAADGRARLMSCLPLRKLPGWLMTLHPNKVRSQVRQEVLAFQNECDDVLWIHWHKGEERAKFHAPDLQQAADFTADYLTKCRQAIVDAGGTLPPWDAVAEHRIASGMAALLLRHKRWLVTFHENGEPQLMSVPQEAAVFTPEKMLSWIREHDGAYQTFLPELLHAIGDRLHAICEVPDF